MENLLAELFMHTSGVCRIIPQLRDERMVEWSPESGQFMGEPASIATWQLPKETSQSALPDDKQNQYEASQSRKQ